MPELKAEISLQVTLLQLLTLYTWSWKWDLIF